MSKPPTPRPAPRVILCSHGPCRQPIHFDATRGLNGGGLLIHTKSGRPECAFQPCATTAVTDVAVGPARITKVWIDSLIENIVPEENTTEAAHPSAGRVGTLNLIAEAKGERWVMGKLRDDILIGFAAGESDPS